MIKLSILISYYKTFNEMMKLLKELKIQNRENLEIILVDDGCHEERFDIFKKENNFDNLHIIHLEKNEGMSNALNKALDFAQGEYIGFIDSDDMITMNYIDILFKTLETQKEQIIYFNWLDFNTNHVIQHPGNYALWKAIYKKDIFPRFVKDRRYHNDVPVQDEIRKHDYSEYYIDNVLYLYNSNREGSLTWIKARME